MQVYLAFYIFLWFSCCILAGAIFIKHRGAYALSHRDYWRFLMAGWKVVTFLVAGFGLTLVAPYTGDPTWDYVDAFFMSVLTFLTAPWVVGVLYKATKRDVPVNQVFVAICLWMFTASWSYDLYILIRDGAYPASWFENIFASSFLYISAGLLWNLDWRKDRGVFFAFMEGGWPTPNKRAVLNKIFWYVLSLMILVAGLLWVFYWPR